ncbi:hypothetical protein [Microbacterium sp. Root53]|uniref:hypothetical protein n=1 Tax=Microbacterium sp. Root53 TaxID=1736553 RepID=UPI003FA589B5
MAERGVRAAPLPDGMGELTYIGPAVTVYAMHDRATQMARTIHRTKDETDERTLDQIRADVFAEIALAGLPTADLIDQHGGDALTSRDRPRRSPDRGFDRPARRRRPHEDHRHRSGHRPVADPHRCR